MASAGRKVYLFTTDVSQYVIDVPNIVQSTGEFGQLTINEIPSFTGNSIAGFWDVNNPVSPFYGAGSDLSGYTITIELDGVNVFVGSVLSIETSNHDGTSTVSLQSSLQKAMERGAIYASPAPETPSEAVAGILNFYLIPYDPGSFAASTAIYDADLVVCEVRAIDPNLKVIDLLQNVLDIGVARLYSLNGVLFYDVYQTQTQASLATFSDAVAGPVTIYSHPISGWVQKDQITGWSIDTVVGTFTTGNTAQQGKSISAGVDAPVRLLDANSAVWIGDAWISYLNQPQKRIEFGIPAAYGKSLPIGSAVTLEYNSMNWDTTILDLIEIENTTRVMSRIVGVTR